MSLLAKALHLPPPGRPRWVCTESAQLDLLYLAWGHRQYGPNPIPVSRHPGWHYVLVNRGKPTLILENEQKDLNPGDFLVIDPDCASGWTDKADGVSDLLVWIWRAGPRCSECVVDSGTYRQWTVGTRLWHKLEQLHGLCRQEVERPDELTKLAIEQLHLAIDVAVARLVQRKIGPPEPSVRMELAIRWMAQNLAEPNPVSALCEYLQISPATLVRMFQTHHGGVPGRVPSAVEDGEGAGVVGDRPLLCQRDCLCAGLQAPERFQPRVQAIRRKKPEVLSRVSGSHAPQWGQAPITRWAAEVLL